MIVLSVALSALVATIHITIKQKDQVFGHVFSPSQYHDVLFLSYIGPPTSTLPTALSMHASLSLLPEASAYFPQIETILSWTMISIFSSPLKSVSTTWNGFARAD